MVPRATESSQEKLQTDYKSIWDWPACLLSLADLQSSQPVHYALQEGRWKHPMRAKKAGLLDISIWLAHMSIILNISNQISHTCSTSHLSCVSKWHHHICSRVPGPNKDSFFFLIYFTPQIQLNNGFWKFWINSSEINPEFHHHYFYFPASSHHHHSSRLQ